MPATATPEAVETTVPYALVQRLPEPEETTHSVTHIANFPLPRDRGDFGTGAIERMSRDDVLVVLVEFDAESAKTALFARRGTRSGEW